ncbi:hypothetical protein PanWU01x14_101510 [Parasponia andersonii]|uniref:Uncharacterized protein n=1 Tax=Parasponia andersonii TaxID=3476 RepID=A0A2P5D356_PARAD|nr:hypothetical protein PanWU01x14_101510 [Parasponia andersonii]
MEEIEELSTRKTTQKNGKGKKRKRQAILEKKKAIDEVIKAASAQKDPLSAFPEFRRYSNDDLSVYLESGRCDKLSSSVKKYIQMGYSCVAYPNNSRHTAAVASCPSIPLGLWEWRTVIWCL